MADVIREWAGVERLFRLNFGGVMDLEEACGKQALGAIFLRLSTGQFFANEVYQIIRLALIGGGTDQLETKQLLDKHFDANPFMENASLASDILVTLMVGVEKTEGGAESDPDPFKFSEVSQVCRVFNMSPQDLRDMSYADFSNMMRGYNSGAEQKAEHVTEDEFNEILSKYEPEALNG